MRKVLENQVDERKLRDLDKSVKFWFKLLAVPAAFWALIYAPEIPRIATLFIISVFYMVYAYAEHVSSIEVRLFVIFSAYMFSVIGIPLGIIFGIWLYTIFFIFGSSLATNPFYYLSALIVFLVSFILWLSLKGIPKQLTKRHWNFLTSHNQDERRIDLSVRRASETLYDQSPLMLLLLFMIVIVAQIPNIPDYLIYSIDQMIPLIATIGLLFIQSIFIYRRITTVDARSHTNSMVCGYDKYPEAVREVAAELKDWNKQNLRFWQ